MSDALPLADRPNLDHYRKLAKEFQRACHSGTADAIRQWATAWLKRKGNADPGDVDRALRMWEGVVKQRPSLAACALTDAQFLHRARARIRELAGICKARRRTRA